MKNLTPVLMIILLAFAGICCSSGSSGEEVDGDTTPQVDGDMEADLDTEAEDEEIETEKEDSKDVLDGIFWLENGETYLANQAFKRAFDVDPDDPKARFGYAFSESMLGLELIAMVGMALEGQVSKSGWEKDPATPSAKAPEGWDNHESYSDWAKTFIDSMFNMIGGHFHKAIELYGPLKEQGGLSIKFEKLPIYLGIYYETWISGEIDDADVYLFDGMSRLLAVVFDFLGAHALEADLGTVISKVTTAGFDDLDMNSAVGIVAWLLNDGQEFFTFDDAGEQQVKDMNALLLGALDDVVKAAQLAEAEMNSKDNQDDDLFYMMEKPRQKQPDMMLRTFHYNKAGEVEESSITMLTPLDLEAVSKFADHLKNGGDPVQMDTVVLPAIASAATLAIGFGLIDRVGFELPIDASILTPQALVVLINGYVSFDVLSLDMHTYFKNPTSLREMLPVWTSDKPRMQNGFFMEWECPEEMKDDGAPDGTGGLMCKGKKDTLVDADHFVGTKYEISKDGKQLRTPYIIMQDPTFGKMLYVDTEALKVEGYSGDKWQMPDQKLFNATLGKVLANLGNLLN